MKNNANTELIQFMLVDNYFPLWNVRNELYSVKCRSRYFQWYFILKHDVDDDNDDLSNSGNLFRKKNSIPNDFKEKFRRN